MGPPKIMNNVMFRLLCSISQVHIKNAIQNLAAPLNWRPCADAHQAHVWLHGSTPSVVPRYESVGCWCAITVEHAAPPTVVPESIQHAADSGFIEARRRSIGLNGSRLVADIRRRSGRRCRLCLDVTMMSLARRVTRRKDSLSSLPVKSSVSVSTQTARRH